MNRVHWMIAFLIGFGWTLPESTHARSEVDGFLYGKIETVSGDEYVGRLRWGKEEAFWDDLFNSSKEDLPAFDHVPRRDRRDRRKRLEVFGHEINASWHHGTASRQFACRFGDIQRIEPTRGDGAVLFMRSGHEIEVAGYSNDVGNSVTVWDDNMGKIDLKWKRIDNIEFMPTPSTIKPGAYRIHGTVETEAGDFTGFIQWDSEECLSTDLLDGDSRDGDIAIEMGRLRSIERKRNHSVISFKDGREIELDGSNDVDDSIRGILVEDPRFGRVKVSWDAFIRAVFDDDNGSSGPTHADFRFGGELRARVEEVGGDTKTGRIHFDMDESEAYEFLNGEFDGVEYNIPFYLIESIEPKSRRSTQVKLMSGDTLRLSDGQDVSEKNDGVLLFVNDSDDDPVYLEWRDVERIEVVH